MRISNRRQWVPKGDGKINLTALDGTVWRPAHDGRPQNPDGKRLATSTQDDPTPPGLCVVCRRLLDTAGPKCDRCGNRASSA